MKISEATFIVVDTETTGLEHGKDQLLELAAVATSLDCPVLGMWSAIVRPTIPIPPEASAVHGLTASDCIDGLEQPAALLRLAKFTAAFPPVGAVAAHNADFDKPFLELESQPFLRSHVLCTERLARHLWKNAPNYKNQTLRYWRGIKPETFGIASHRALGDALVTAALLRDELLCAQTAGIDTVAGVLELAESPIVFETWPFGKHRGNPIAGTDPSYIAWCLRDMKDLSRDMRFTLERALQKGEPLSV